MNNLENKVAIITGASRGIGKVIAEETAKAGAKAVCVSRSLSDVENVAKDINEQGFTAIAMACDITNGEQYQKLVKSVNENFGSVDILVNNAGVTKDGLIMRMSEDDWDVVINTNLKGAFPVNPTTDEIFIIRPLRCFIICLVTALVPLNAPFKFVLITTSQSSSDMRIIKPSFVTPALLTSIST